MCVQNLDDSLNPAIRIKYRSLQRSSSMYEPRHPLLKVVSITTKFIGSMAFFTNEMTDVSLFLQ